MSTCLPKVLALVGLRCSGKSTVGARLAAAVGARFIDLDARIAAACGESNAAAVIETRGLPAFREIEEAELADSLRRTDPGRVVVATGGGAIESATSRARLRRDVFTVWLRAPVEVLVQRLEADPSPRPRLVGSTALDEFRRLEALRAPLYREVSRRAFDVESRSPEDIANEIERAWIA